MSPGAAAKMIACYHAWGTP